MARAPKEKTEKFIIPKKIGEAVDLYYTLREEKSALARSVKAVEEKQKALSEHLINTIPKSNSTGVAGKLCRVTITTKDVPVVEDWDKFYKHILKTKDFSLLQKRLSAEAINERWDAARQRNSNAPTAVVPGVGEFRVVGISVNKL